MRDNNWLKKQLDYLHKTYFAGVPLVDPVEIKFGREAKYRFGSIKIVKPKGTKTIGHSLFTIGKRQKVEDEVPTKSIITITAMFKALDIPEEVVQYTIAHELCHYAHGFSSSNKRLFRHPHHGGVVNKEIRERGAERLIRAYKVWIKGYRKRILAGRVNF